ncbi:N-methylhydantoinase B [Tamaricihabitans halophyticus]|uniref:N-methylhydantoinase B n=1 Tax=Tamaricihabitans halophyticus TaxID=1262583 RepID=A0A4R2QVP7_9PSEU|nr:hydantoinase B/oxoprolinase family protein [Tamaricihabitans halophyticus]TCP54143.1 N-methylhydantoinase B [Tamaricihabitans halophyticus]
MSSTVSRSAALSATEIQEHYGTDRTTAEVIRHALEHIAVQMQIKINTGSLSPALSEMNDFGIGLLAPRDEAADLDFDAIAMGTAAPGHYVINQFYARMAIEHWGAERFRPGDVLLYNDPFRGGSHINDVGTVMPIFVDGALMGFAAAITHWLDIGGPVPTGFGPGVQHDMYAEGLRISPRLLYQEGELVRETLELFTTQTRIPDISVNDLQVIKAALAMGVDMISGYVRRYGPAAYTGAIRYTLDYNERAMRLALARIPDGDYTAEDQLDNNMDGDPMPIRCTVRKRGMEVEVDFSGSSREEWGGYACTWSDAVTAAHLGLQVVVPETISANAGAYRPVQVVTPAGNCLHALPPMSTNAGHVMFGQKAISVTKAAFAKAMPELAVAEHYDDVALFSFAGVDDRAGMPTPFVYLRIFMGPFGGHAEGDGCGYMFVEGGNCVEPSVELDEETYPILQLAREFVTDTAGAGKHRGGPATRVLLSPLVDAESFYQLDQCRQETIGVLGGTGGAKAAITVHRNGLDDWLAGRELGDPEVLAGIADASGRLTDSEDEPGAEFRLSKRAGVRFQARDLVLYQVAGGAGCGDPSARDPEAVRADVRNEILTSETARTTYGHDGR